MKIGVLTSSRADFGVYYPLLKKMFGIDFFEMEIIAFGTHLDKKYNYTVNEIIELGFPVAHKIYALPRGYTPKDISQNIAKTIKLFSDFWNDHKFDLVLAIGDRYEMFAAVYASSPFNIPIAHFHAGETTLGAIDNSFRHSISLISKYLFVSCEEYKKRAIEISGTKNNVYNVGALSIDNLNSIKLYSKEELYNKFHVDFKLPTILSTFHPETIAYTENENHIKEILAAFKILMRKYQIVITMPNSDTMGLLIRKKIMEFSKKNKNIKTFESLGLIGYLSAMKYCKFLLGNSSSGFVEASYFPKHVINIGNRQKGRIITPNIKTVRIIAKDILKSVEEIVKNPFSGRVNIYGDGNAGDRIIKILKDIYEQN